MAETFEIFHDVGPLADLVAEANADLELTEKRLRVQEQQARCRAAVDQYRKQLDLLYDDIEKSGHDADWIIQAVKAVEVKERSAREQLRPGIYKLRERLGASHYIVQGETPDVIKDSIDIGEAWLSLLASLKEKLLALATERRAAATELRRARPDESEIDYDELSHEHVARYPKIRTRLAE